MFINVDFSNVIVRNLLDRNNIVMITVHQTGQWRLLPVRTAGMFGFEGSFVPAIKLLATLHADLGRCLKQMTQSLTSKQKDGISHDFTYLTFFCAMRHAMQHQESQGRYQARVDNTLAFLVMWAEVVLVPKLVRWQIVHLPVCEVREWQSRALGISYQQSSTCFKTESVHCIAVTE